MAESAQQSGHALHKMNQAFLAANPQVRLEIITKAPYGLGGMVNMLLTTRAVVPKRLPDVFVFDVSELHLLVDRDILVPLDESVPNALWDDLFPFAPESVTSKGRRMAMPFQTDILFLAYNEALTSKPSRVWSEFAASQARVTVLPRIYFCYSTLPRAAVYRKMASAHISIRPSCRAFCACIVRLLRRERSTRMCAISKRSMTVGRSIWPAMPV
jgi:hypothetical protein